MLITRLVYSKKKLRYNVGRVFSVWNLMKQLVSSIRVKHSGMLQFKQNPRVLTVHPGHRQNIWPLNWPDVLDLGTEHAKCRPSSLKFEWRIEESLGIMAVEDRSTWRTWPFSAIIMCLFSFSSICLSKLLINPNLVKEEWLLSIWCLSLNKNPIPL